MKDEQAFSKRRIHQQSIDARTYDEFIGNIGDLFAPSERWYFFEATGIASA